MTMPAVSARQVQDAAQAIDDLTRARARVGLALPKLRERRLVIDGAWRYYDGDHPPLWLTSKMASLFRGMATRLHDNLCEMAVDALLSRLEVTGWEDVPPLQLPGQLGQQLPTAEGVMAAAATALWGMNSLDLEQEELYRHALVSSVGYVLVWPGEDGQPEIVQQDPRTIYVEYGSMRRDDRLWAVKCWWDQEAVRWRANLYEKGQLGQPSTVVRLLQTQRGNAESIPDGPNGFTIDPDDPGGPSGLPTSDVPLVPFQRRRDGRSRLHNLTPIQDKINKLAANKLVAAEFAAFRQRVFITTQQLPDNAISNAPDRAIVLDPGTPDAPTSVHEFAVTELANYDDAITAEVGKFFTVAQLPRHLIVGTGSASPSGEAIKADEGPFVQLVDSWVARLGASWQDVMALLGVQARPVWAETATHHDLTTAQTVKGFTDAGAPLGLVLARYAGWSEEEVAEAQAEASAREAQAAAAGAVALAAFDQGAALPQALPGMADQE